MSSKPKPPNQNHIWWIWILIGDIPYIKTRDFTCYALSTPSLNSFHPHLFFTSMYLVSPPQTFSLIILIWISPLLSNILHDSHTLLLSFLLCVQSTTNLPSLPGLPPYSGSTCSWWYRNTTTRSKLNQSRLFLRVSSSNTSNILIWTFPNPAPIVLLSLFVRGCAGHCDQRLTPLVSRNKEVTSAPIYMAFPLGRRALCPVIYTY